MPGAETSTSLKDELSGAFDGAETSAGNEPPIESNPNAVPATADPALEPPKHWSETDRGLFGKAPREIQSRWLERETEYTKGVDSKSQELARLKRDQDFYDSLTKPFERDLGLRGESRQQFLSRLTQAHRYLLEKPQEALPWLAKSYGVDLASFAQNASPADPVLQSMETRFAEYDQRIRAQEQQVRNNEFQSNLQRVEAFATAKNADGQPAHPYFDEVASDIQRLMQAGERDLDTAYRKAIRMNDAVFEKAQSEKTSREAAGKEAARKAEIDKAKRAAVGTTGEASGTAKPITLRDELTGRFQSWGS